MTSAGADSKREREIAALGPWFHNLHLPDGSQTMPDHHFGDFPATKWRGIAPYLPSDLAGWSVLDIGCNAGFYSFELAKRGAEVIGIDMNDHYLAQARWAAGQFGLTDRVRFENRHVFDLARSAERYDLVLFMGVFYHLRHPLLALDLIAQRVKRLLVFQSLTTPGKDVLAASVQDHQFQNRDSLNHPGWPKMAFIEGTFCLDPTNWWAPNHSGILAMLRSSGLRVVAEPDDEIYLCEPAAPSDFNSLVRDELAAVRRGFGGG